jgi:hypothetical protein
MTYTQIKYAYSKISLNRYRCVITQRRELPYITPNHIDITVADFDVTVEKDTLTLHLPSHYKINRNFSKVEFLIYFSIWLKQNDLTRYKLLMLHKKNISCKNL